MKRILCLIMIVVAFSFAQEEIFIRNICDTLGGKKVELQLQQIEETMWYGSKNLSKSDSVKKMVYKDYQDVNPLKGKFEDAVLPVSVTASCVESRYNLFRYATWSNSHWSLVDDDDDYATMIMDVNQYSYQGYDATNSYNILAIKKGALPENGSYSTNELMVSKTFELGFDWWYSIALYYAGTRYFYASVVALDSLTAVEKSMKGLDVPDSISKVQLQVLHGVLVDPNKNPVSSSSLESSSSSAASSSSEAASSSSVASSTSEASSSSKESSSSSKGSSSSIASSSSKAKSSSSEASSSSEKKLSSSSKKTTAIDRLVSMPRVFEAREVRRLDGSLVKVGEQLMPGVYYVKGVDGRWKKQVELP